MPKPQIDGIYQVYANRLNTQLANAGDKNPKIPVRVLSGNRWIMPKAGTSIQPHQAVSARRFRAVEFDRSLSFPEGLLVCWVQEPGKPGETGLRAATGPDAVRKLRALQRPDLAHYRDFLYGAAKEHNLQIDVVNAPHLTDLIPEESKPVTDTAEQPEQTAFHFVAPVESVDGDLIADVLQGKRSVRITDAVDRLPGGIRAASMYAVWDFPASASHDQVAVALHTERPARILIHVSNGELLEIADHYRLQLIIKED
jgi:hypothetical protein